MHVHINKVHKSEVNDKGCPLDSLYRILDNEEDLARTFLISPPAKAKLVMDEIRVL
jgi:hypothetical protein